MASMFYLPALGHVFESNLKQRFCFFLVELASEVNPSYNGYQEMPWEVKVSDQIIHKVLVGVVPYTHNA